MQKLFLLSCFLIVCTAARAQDVAINTIEVNSSQIIVHYDLLDTTKNRTYTVFVYSSLDNFLAPLKKISGDAGLEVKPGPNKRIVWDSKEELGPMFNSGFQLEVRGNVYVPFIQFEGFNAVKVRKRAVPFLVKWFGGTRQNILNFELYKGEKLVYSFPNVPNTYEYKLVIPVSVKPGKGYHLKVSDTKNKDQVVNTGEFAIKRKYSLALKAVPVVLVGGAVYFLTSGHTSPKEKPGPPDPPGSTN
ncbi:MAG TPA: hypothetical protein VF473_07205 [Cyclobacteriaceae bacterium]